MLVPCIVCLQEIEKLGLTNENLKKSHAQEVANLKRKHEGEVAEMTRQLVGKQDNISSLENLKRQEELRGQHTEKNMSSKLIALAALKLKERRQLEAEKEMLRQEQAALQRAKEKQKREAEDEYARLQSAKQYQEEVDALKLKRAQEQKEREAKEYQAKMEKMRKLQELALGGVGGSSPGARGSPPKSIASTNGRGRLYWETLKAKEGSSPGSRPQRPATAGSRRTLPTNGQYSNIDGYP